MRTSITVTLSQSQKRRVAMRNAGLCPQAMAVKLPTRVELDRKQALKRGQVKHKGRAWE